MARAWLGIGVVALAACAPASPDGADPARAGAILGGTADTVHDGVLAVLQEIGGGMAHECTGTTIAQSGSSAYLLTAAHCVVAQDTMMHVLTPVTVVPTSSMVVLPGPDWQISLADGQHYLVSQISIAPGYDGTPASPKDVAIIQFTSPSALPVIPILEPEDDLLAVGATLTLVGYGVTEAGGPNSVRRTVDRPIDTMTRLLITFLQNDEKGGCSGDSGGPALSHLAGVERVAGVFVATHDDLTQTCVESAAVRVSSLATFIHGVIGPASATDGGAPVDGGAPLDAGIDVAPPAAMDAGAPADGQVDDAGADRSGPPAASSGCGCDVRGGRSPAWPWVGFFIAAAAARPRRRRGWAWYRRRADDR